MTDPLMETSRVPQPPPVRESPTDALVATIELMTGSAWTKEQRAAVGDTIRAYRFNQIGAVMLRVHNLVKKHAGADLSEMIFLGKF